MTSYVPDPLDTSDVRLDPRIRELLESLARNTHEVWARNRIADGWSWGPKRDDAALQNPDLVPYDELPESEKDYDRATAEQVLKAIIAAGFHIEPPVPPDGEDELADLVDLKQRLADPRADTHRTGLTLLWREHDPERWIKRPTLYRLLAARLLEGGKPLAAYDVVREAREHGIADLGLRQVEGRALARAGATRRAATVFESLRDDGDESEETLGSLARTYKDLALDAGSPPVRAHLLGKAQAAYAEAYRITGGYWSGINAATLGLLRGDHEAARAEAERVRARCLHVLEASRDAPGDFREEETDPYWLRATLGEACLILGHRDEACRWYEEAVGLGAARVGDVASTRRNARLLLEHLPGDPAPVEACFPVPRVVVFAGHMIDRPGRATPRFPAQIVDHVAQAIADELDDLGPVIGFASAACGSDILFLEAVQARGAETRVVLPYSRDVFVRDSVAILEDGDWPERFDAVLHGARGVATASTHKLALGSMGYEFANQVLLGLAGQRARQLDAELTPLAVWDGRPGDGPGGTASIVEQWRDMGLPVRTIQIQMESEEDGTNAAPSSPAQTAAVVDDETEIRALLFADVKGFSKLTDEQFPGFRRGFLSQTGDLLESGLAKPVVVNTWGDALYMVFDRVEHAGLFALALSERLAATNWAAEGLPESLGIRVGLHAGPVHGFVDPVTRQFTYGGTHVSHAARIEPVTPPGQVYASQAFAALAFVEGVEAFNCEYVGRTPLAKGFGVFPTYHVRRRHGEESAS